MKKYYWFIGIGILAFLYWYWFQYNSQMLRLTDGTQIFFVSGTTKNPIAHPETYANLGGESKVLSVSQSILDRFTTGAQYD